MQKIPALKFPRQLPSVGASLAILASSSVSASGAILTDFSFGGQGLTSSVILPDTSISEFEATGPNYGGSGLTATTAGNFFTRDGGTIFAVNTDYVGFTITPDSGFQLDLERFGFNYGIQSLVSAPSFESTFQVRSSLDNFGSSFANTTFTLGTDTGTATPQSYSVDLSASSFQGLTDPFEVRIYTTLSASNSDFVNRFDDVVLEGEVSPIPEPSGVLIGAFMVLGLMSRRR